MILRVVYFAWVRERIGKAEEEIDPPSDVTSVSGVIAWLASRGDNYAHAFERAAMIRAAVDHVHVKGTASISGAKEIAFFPPMTGG